MIRRLILLGAVLVLAFAAYVSGVFAPARRALPANARADRILVEKTAHRMTLYSGGRVLRAYTIAIGHGGLGRKSQLGDARTPEGRYRIDARNAHSCCHLALHISYPSPADRKAAAAHGVSPGGDIMIHALRTHTGWIGSWHRLLDWTDGCIAVTDDEMDEIWRAVPTGTPIEIRH